MTGRWKSCTSRKVVPILKTRGWFTYHLMFKFFAVIPAKAGIHCFPDSEHCQQWIPAFAGMTAKNSSHFFVPVRN
jgi:hypothetical protein